MEVPSLNWCDIVVAEWNILIVQRPYLSLQRDNELLDSLSYRSDFLYQHTCRHISTLITFG